MELTLTGFFIYIIHIIKKTIISDKDGVNLISFCSESSHNLNGD